MGTSLEAGVVVGDFRVESRAGSGGMGVVYRARQLSLDRVVALKVLGGALTHPTDVARFLRAATAAARLTHPHIAAVHYVGQDDQVCYLAMEFIDGRSLQEMIRALAAGEADSLDAARTPAPSPSVAQRFYAPDTPTTDLPADPAPAPSLAPSAAKLIVEPAYQRRCAELVRDAALALHHAHVNGVVHRDVKPGNLMLDRAGTVKVIDFGVARFFEDSTLTSTGALVGTPLYMSPEQVTGRVELTATTDVYSLGLVLIELLALRPPILAGSREELLRRIVTRPVPAVTRVNPAVPAGLSAVAHKAAAQDPDERYASAAAFAADLQAWLEGKPVAAKPRRCDGTRAEIAAARPAGLTQLGFGLVTTAVLAGFGVIVLGVLSDSGIGRRLPGWVIPALGGGWLTMAVVHAVAARELLRGTRRARAAVTAATVTLGCQMLVVGAVALTSGTLAWTGEGYALAGVCGVLGAGVSPLGAIMMRQRRTRDWFAFAARVRAEAAVTMPAEGSP